jgi:hypothetical protein
MHQAEDHLKAFAGLERFMFIGDRPTSPSPAALATSAEEYGRGRAAGLEEAAKVADGNRTDDESMWDRAAETIARMIRALAAKEVG